MDVLELGCGWGSLCLWIAAHRPDSRVVAVSQLARTKGMHRRLVPRGRDRKCRSRHGRCERVSHRSPLRPRGLDRDVRAYEELRTANGPDRVLAQARRDAICAPFLATASLAGNSMLAILGTGWPATSSVEALCLVTIYFCDFREICGWPVTGSWMGLTIHEP